MLLLFTESKSEENTKREEDEKRKRQTTRRTKQAEAFLLFPISLPASTQQSSSNKHPQPMDNTDTLFGQQEKVDVLDALNIRIEQVVDGIHSSQDETEFWTAVCELNEFLKTFNESAPFDGDSAVRMLHHAIEEIIRIIIDDQPVEFAEQVVLRQHNLTSNSTSREEIRREHEQYLEELRQRAKDPECFWMDTDTQSDTYDKFGPESFLKHLNRAYFGSLHVECHDEQQNVKGLVQAFSHEPTVVLDNIKAAMRSGNPDASVNVLPAKDGIMPKKREEAHLLQEALKAFTVQDLQSWADRYSKNQTKDRLTGVFLGMRDSWRREREGGEGERERETRGRQREKHTQAKSLAALSPFPLCTHTHTHTHTLSLSLSLSLSSLSLPLPFPLAFSLPFHSLLSLPFPLLSSSFPPLLPLLFHSCLASVPHFQHPSPVSNCV